MKILLLAELVALQVFQFPFSSTCLNIVLEKKRLFFLMYSLASTQKNEANFQILQWNPYFDY